MSAGLPPTAVDDGLFVSADFLAHTGQCIVFAQQPENRLARSISGTNSCFDAANADLNVKSSIAQQLRRPFAGMILAVRPFGVLPDIQRQPVQLFPPALNFGKCDLLMQVNPLLYYYFPAMSKTQETQ